MSHSAVMAAPSGVPSMPIPETDVLGVLTILPGDVARRVPAMAMMAGHGDPMLAIE